MMIMPGNNTGKLTYDLHHDYPGSIGLLMSPDGWRNPKNNIPYALDNGAFTGFNELKFKVLLKKANSFKYKPIFVAVPDVVSDAEATNRLWHIWKDKIDFRKAFVVQDGHEPQDIPREAFAVFVGGSTSWKIKSAHKFKGITQWLHAGRVNTKRRLEWACDIVKADSCDGTGFRRSKRQMLDLIEFISGKGQMKLWPK